ncbi:ranBP-type and C3HC4-type zinc finger-containing protein 1-like [Culex pipiens pallens]|uniref:ranBP-type and C3HC4-type zinc finger-containing protein 1-like n=1 Tax=Culex pipiens pallens TaxID=42434 RepID=UPI001954B9FA|nr:ranBP-type and C3HC4-type zinc finger-containing protein 1-like [Culex pipiens pallens]
MSTTAELMQAAWDATLVRNFEPTKCLLCNHDLRIHEGVILRDCFHIFCDRCLVRTIKITMLHSVQVHCPAQMIGDRGCMTLLQEREIRELLSGEDYRKYERKCLELAETEATSSVHCLVPHCKGWIELTGFVSSFVCPVCSCKNCLSCRAIHIEMTCNEYQTLNSFTSGTPSGSNRGKPQSNPTVDLDQLWSASEAVLARNMYSSKCPICDDDVPINGGVILRDCCHIFCEECLINTIKATLDENVEVQCPAFVDDGQQRCSTIVQEREIKSLLKTEEYEKFEQRCLEVAEGSFTSSVHCLTPNCKGWVVLDGNVESFRCPICSVENCLSCKMIHVDKSCEEYRAEIKRNGEEELSESAIKVLLENREAVLCPNCKRLIIKNGGCDHMTCLKCRYEFYWSTLAPYRR